MGGEGLKEKREEGVLMVARGKRDDVMGGYWETRRVGNDVRVEILLNVAVCSMPNFFALLIKIQWGRAAR